MYIYIYVYVYICICIYIYIYTFSNLKVILRPPTFGMAIFCRWSDPFTLDDPPGSLSSRPEGPHFPDSSHSFDGKKMMKPCCTNIFPKKTRCEKQNHEPCLSYIACFPIDGQGRSPFSHAFCMFLLYLLQIYHKYKWVA